MNIFSRLKSDNLLRHSAILFAGMMIVNVCNMAFQMLVSRALPDAEYVLLAAFLGVLAIIQRPLSTLTVGVNHYSCLLREEGRHGDIRRLLLKWLFIAGCPALVVGLLVILNHETFERVFYLDRPAPVLILGLVIPALFVVPILGGAVQGLQLFGWSSGASIMGALSRFIFGAGFVWFYCRACGWAMFGHGLSIYVTGGILLVGLVLALRGKGKSAKPLPSMRYYLLQNLFVQAAYAVLMTADVILMKHYLPNDLEFAYAATLGRMVIFLPSAIVAAMFPKVVSTGGITREQRSVLMRSLGMTALFVAAAVGGCVLLPGLLARIICGIPDASDYLRRMIGAMALVMGFAAMSNVILQFLVAQRRFLSAASVVGFAALYLVGVYLFHDSSWSLVLWSGISNAGALLVLLWVMLRVKVSA